MNFIYWLQHHSGFYFHFFTEDEVIVSSGIGKCVRSTHFGHKVVCEVVPNCQKCTYSPIHMYLLLHNWFFLLPIQNYCWPIKYLKMIKVVKYQRADYFLSPKNHEFENAIWKFSHLWPLIQTPGLTITAQIANNIFLQI